MTTTELQISGLCCAHEAAQVEQALGRVPGVREARVNPVSFRMRVVHEVPQDAIIDAVSGLGYGCRPLNGPVPAAAAGRRRLILTLLAGLALLAAWLTQSIPLYVIAAGLGGLTTFAMGLRALARLNFDMNALMTVGVAGAFALGEWSEGAMICFLFSLSTWLEAATTERTRDAIEKLLDLAPARARVVRDGQEVEVPVEEAALGERLRLRPGDRVPLDARIVEGTSTFDQSAITGESVPVTRGPGDAIYAGTINGEAALEAEITHLSGDTTLDRIVHMVEEAQALRAPFQQWVDRFAQRYTPIVLVLALLLAVVPPLALGAAWETWIYRALSLLVLACPCALVVSTPVALAAGIGHGARNGVLIKGGAQLERGASLKALALDKTGTITRGEPRVVKVVPLGDLDAEQLLRLAAAAESRSEHPLGRAIVTAAGGALEPATEFQAFPGLGAQARVAGELVKVGSPALFPDVSPAGRTALEELAREPHTLVVVGGPQGVHGVIALADPVRPESKAALERLDLSPIVMLTGDNRATATSIARQVGLEDVRAELLPAGKLAAIAELERQHGPTGMVGDGINDAPALAAASLGIAMGAAGSDVAVETADVALMSEGLGRLPFFFRLCRETTRIIRQNVAFALAVKLFALVLVFPGWLTLWMAVLSDTGATVLVTLNALRLFSLTPETFSDCRKGCCG